MLTNSIPDEVTQLEQTRLEILKRQATLQARRSGGPLTSTSPCKTVTAQPTCYEHTLFCIIC